MSTGSENAQPQPVDQAIAAVAAEPTPPAPEPELTDPDLIELRDAKAAAQAEESAAKAPEGEQVTGTPAATTPSAAAGDPQQPPAAPAAKAPTVPKARLDQVLRERDEAREQAAYHRGVAEARAPAVQPASANGQQPTAQTPEQRLAGIAAEIDDLAKKFDDGEITMADFKKQERVLSAREQAIREDVLLAKVPQAKAEGGGDTLYLDDVTTQLVGQHPWVPVFDQVGTKADWAYLEATARDRLVERGIELAPGNLGSATLRREMASVADELGPVLLASRAQAKGIALPGQTPPPAPVQQPAKAPLSPVAQNRLAKLEQQSNAPPNLAAMTGSSGAPAVSDAQIENMSDDEIAALPAAVRQKYSSARPA